MSPWRLGVLSWVLSAGLSWADTVLFSNGPLINLPFGGSSGAHASRVQDELGLTTLAFGGGTIIEFDGTSSRVVDDFVVPGPWSWEVTGVTVFATDDPFPVGTGTLELWNAPPWQVGAMPLFSGTAMLPGALGYTPMGYRVRSDNPLSTLSPIRPYELAASWTLAPGQYWLSWSPAFAFISPHQSSQAKVPPVTRPGLAATGNGRVGQQYCSLLGGCDPIVWQDALDQGNLAPQGFPFVIRGRPGAVRKGDLGGPSGPDLLFRNVAPASPDFNRNQAWLMNGVVRSDQAFLTPDPPGPTWAIAGVDDFDTAGAPWNGPDGSADLALRDLATGELQFWLMNGHDRVGPALPLVGAASPDPSWALAATADFDADGQPDILWRHSLSGQLVVWRMNGTAYRSSLLPSPDHALDGNWGVVAAHDYNADGATDLLWYNGTSGRVVTWYLNEALQRIAGQFLAPAQAADNNWRVVASADYSRDSAPATPPLGSADVVWRNADSGRLVVWHLDFASTRVFGEFTVPASEAAALDWVVAGPK